MSNFHQQSNNNNNSNNAIVSVPQCFAQSKCGRMFQSSTEILPIIGTSNILYRICNPCNCNSTLYLSTLTCSNYSPSPISIKTIYHSTINEECLKNAPTVNTNLYVDCTCRSKGCVQCGTRIDICNDIIASSLVVNGYSSHTINFDGGIIIAPGCNVLYEICSINCSQTALANIDLSWWEIPNCEELIRCCL